VGISYSVVLGLFLREANRAAEPAADSDSFVAPARPSVLRGLGLVLGNVSFWILLVYYAIPSLPGWATKNWLPTLMASSLHIDMASAGPLATISIAASSFVGVIFGGLLSDRWVQANVRGRVYTSAIGLSLTIPALVFIGFGHSPVSVVGAALCFGLGFGMFDANNMPILCQLVPARSRATAYGLMNTMGVFAGAVVTNWLGKSTDAGHLGSDFALLAGIVLVALLVQLAFLKPKAVDLGATT
jgi:hypothetical protein